MNKTCFVIMPIGDQKCGDKTIVTETELRQKYDNLITEAIHNARPELEIIRADDISLPGTITTDVYMQILSSDYVVVDVTYPNLNVFYELGLRHASKPSTILIKDKKSVVPFDISNCRYINYEDSTAGLKDLTDKLKSFFDAIDSNPNKIDNHFLDTAKIMKFNFMKFDNPEEADLKKKTAIKNLFLKIIGNPKILNRTLTNTDPNTAALLKVLSKDPETAEFLIDYLIEAGSIKL
jgi:hypothetical protein